MFQLICYLQTQISQIEAPSTTYRNKFSFSRCQRQGYRRANTDATNISIWQAIKTSAMNIVFDVISH